MASINDRYSKLNYQTLSNKEIMEEYKYLTTGLRKLSKIEVKNRVSMLNSISKKRGFILPEFDFGQITINEKTYEKPVVSITATTPRKVHINYGKVIFGLISLGIGISIFHTGLRLRFLLIIIGITLLVRGTTDPNY
jgi:hypothetical protein